MKTQLKRLLALNLALILLLCAVFPPQELRPSPPPTPSPSKLPNPPKIPPNRRPPHPTPVRTPSPSMAKPAPSARNGNLE